VPVHEFFLSIALRNRLSPITPFIEDYDSKLMEINDKSGGYALRLKYSLHRNAFDPDNEKIGPFEVDSS